MCRVLIRLARNGVERSGTHAWLLLLALALQSRGLPPAQAAETAPAPAAGSGVVESTPAPAAAEPAAPSGSVTPAPTRPSGTPRPASTRGQAPSEPTVEIWQPETYLAPRRPRRPDSSSPPGTPIRTAPGSPLPQPAPGRLQQRVDPITGVPLGAPGQPGAPGPLDPRMMPMAPPGSPPPVGQLRRRSPFLPGQPMVPLPPGANPMMPGQPVQPSQPGQPGQPVRPQGALPPGSALPPLEAPPGSRPAPVAPSKGSAGPWSVLVPLLALAGAVGVFLAERKRRSAGQGIGMVRPRINLADRLRPGSGGTRPKDR